MTTVSEDMVVYDVSPKKKTRRYLVQWWSDSASLGKAHWADGNEYRTFFFAKKDAKFWAEVGGSAPTRARVLDRRKRKS